MGAGGVAVSRARKEALLPITALQASGNICLRPQPDSSARSCPHSWQFFMSGQRSRALAEVNATLASLHGGCCSYTRELESRRGGDSAACVDETADALLKRGMLALDALTNYHASLQPCIKSWRKQAQKCTTVAISVPLVCTLLSMCIGFYARWMLSQPIESCSKAAADDFRALLLRDSTHSERTVSDLVSALVSRGCVLLETAVQRAAFALRWDCSRLSLLNSISISPHPFPADVSFRSDPAQCSVARRGPDWHCCSCSARWAGCSPFEHRGSGA